MVPAIRASSGLALRLFVPSPSNEGVMTGQLSAGFFHRKADIGGEPSGRTPDGASPPYVELAPLDGTQGLEESFPFGVGRYLRVDQIQAFFVLSPSRGSGSHFRRLVRAEALRA